VFRCVLSFFAREVDSKVDVLPAKQSACSFSFTERSDLLRILTPTLPPPSGSVASFFFKQPYGSSPVTFGPFFLQTAVPVRVDEPFPYFIEPSFFRVNR